MPVMNSDLHPADKGAVSSAELSTLLPQVAAVARDAGALIMEFYRTARNAGAVMKDDGSPVTRADMESSALIEARLAQLTPGVVVVSEENSVDAAGQKIYWTVDPLDGTKEFIGKTDGFAVKIALMDQASPVLAVVYAPALYSLYCGLKDGLATRQIGTNPPKTLAVRENSKWDLSVLFNETHADRGLYNLQRARFKERGLTLPEHPRIYPCLPRNLSVAEGLSDIHVNTGRDPSLMKGGGYEWDNAPDYLILKNAGGEMRRLADGAPLTFGDARHPMPSYITIGDKNLGKKFFPEL